jgi:hypothetical protein
MSVDDYDDEDNDVQECPYCLSASGCAHLLLRVDRTFRTAEGGALMRAFNDRWSKLCEEGGDDFDEREPFDGLLDEVDACADSSFQLFYLGFGTAGPAYRWSAEYDHEGGPGMSSVYSIYYVESADAAKEAVARFASGGEA